MKKRTLKQIVFDLLDKGKLTDQIIVNEYGKLPNLQTVEQYKYLWLRKNKYGKI